MWTRGSLTFFSCSLQRSGTSGCWACWEVLQQSSARMHLNDHFRLPSLSSLSLWTVWQHQKEQQADRAFHRAVPPARVNWTSARSLAWDRQVRVPEVQNSYPLFYMWGMENSTWIRFPPGNSEIKKRKKESKKTSKKVRKKALKFKNLWCVSMLGLQHLFLFFLLCFVTEWIWVIV